MSEPLQYACDEHGWCDFSPCPKCPAPSSLAAMPGSAITDTDRINWLESRPLPAEVRGGNDDGATAKFWGISAYDGTLRDAIDTMIKNNSERQKPMGYE